MLIKATYRAIDLESEASKKRYWDAYERMRGKWYTAVEVQVKHRFKEELGQVLVCMQANPLDPMAGALRGLEAQDDAWGKLLQAVYFSVGEQFAPAIGDTLNPGPKSYRPARNYLPANNPKGAKEAFSDRWMSFILNYIKTQSSTKITQITDTTREIIRLALHDGVRNGETMAQLSNRLRDAYSDMTPYRASLIARTEVINASNAASVAGAKASGAAVMKQWLSSRDDRVREDHEEADGQTVPLDEPFTVGGYQLMWPGDPSLGAPGKEIINCRCTVIYVG
jgi:SPP1 gp7 family putative phage head morphogenesis protein